MGKKRKEICYYCGKYGEITREHVPPKGFFVEAISAGVNPNLITVWACKQCNTDNASKDENARNDLFVVASKYGENTEMQRKTQRSCERDPKKKHRMKNQIFSSPGFHRVGGIYQYGILYGLNDDFWEGQIKRWTKALFFRENSRWIGDCEIEVKWIERNNKIDAIKNNFRRVVVPNIFQYFYFSTLSDGKQEFDFLFDFYKNLAFYSSGSSVASRL